MSRTSMLVALALCSALAFAAACGDDDDSDTAALGADRSGADVTTQGPGGPDTGPGTGVPAAGGTPVTVTVSSPGPDPASTPEPRPSPTEGPPLRGSVVSLDADGSTPGVDAAATYPTGSEFTVAFVVESTGEPYQGYQFAVRRDESVLDYVSLEHLKKAGLTGCSGVAESDGNRVASGCLDFERREIMETGALATVTFRCATAGTSELHLVTPAEILSAGRTGPGTKLVSLLATEGLPLTMNDASVTCS